MLMSDGLRQISVRESGLLAKSPRRRWSICGMAVLMLCACTPGREPAQGVASPQAGEAQTVAETPATTNASSQAAGPVTASASDANLAATEQPEATRDVEGQEGEANKLFRPSFQECADASEGVTPAMQDCIADEYEFHDQQLNANYRALMASLPKDRAAALRQTQRNWIAERDQACRWNAEEEGQAGRLVANHCLLERTAKRAVELANMKHDVH